MPGYGATDIIIAGATDVSILFAMKENQPITGFKLSFTRFDEGDGTSYEKGTATALTALASIITAHTPNYALYLEETDATDPNYLLLRVDFPDSAFATGKDKVVCNVYDDGNDLVAQRIYDLKGADAIFEDGAVWINTVSGVAGTSSYKNGVPTNPVSNLANAKTIADAVKLKRFKIILEKSSIDLGAVDYSAGYEFIGESGASVDLGTTADVENCFFKDLDIIESGVGVDVGTGYFTLQNCWIGNGTTVVNLPRAYAENCTLLDLLHLNDSGQYAFNGLRSIAYNDAEAVLDFSDSASGHSAGRNVVITDFSGRLTIKNMVHADDSIEIAGNGEIIIDSSCDDGDAIISGAIKVTNGGTGVFALTDNTVAGQTGIDANIISINGALTSGNNAVLNLKQLNIQSDANLPGIFVRGSGTGHGVEIVAGATGDGVNILGGSTSGDGIHCSTPVLGRGIYSIASGGFAGAEFDGGDYGTGFHCRGGSGGGAGIIAKGYLTGNSGFVAQGTGSGSGIDATGGVTGHGIKGTGGSTSGNGIDANGSSTSGHGINATGGAIGDGIRGNGGSTSGNGISAYAPTLGRGLYVIGQGGFPGAEFDGGDNGNGVQMRGGYSGGAGLFIKAYSTNNPGTISYGNGTGDGISAIGGATGNGIEASGGATSGHGINAISNAGDDDGIKATGNGDGSGIMAKGGSTGHGAYFESGVSGGNGLKLNSLGDTGLKVNGGSTGHGAYFAGGSSGGGIYMVSGSSGNVSGLQIIGKGTGHGIYAIGGSTGDGIHTLGGSTSGSGIYSEGQTLGYGLDLHGNGASMHGLRTTGEGLNASGLFCVGANDASGFYTQGDGIGRGISAIGGATGSTAYGIYANSIGSSKDYGGIIDGNLVKIDDETDGIVGLQKGTEAINYGSAITGSLLKSSMTTNLTETDDDHYIGLVCKFIGSGALRGQGATVSDYDGTTKTIYFEDDLTEAPVNGQEFVLV